jgi:hypothetical protein
VTVRQAVNDTIQRGGEPLSLVDLVLAGTVDLDLAALLAAHVAEGSSFLVGASPGGAGKTTVMGALLGLLPEDELVVPVDGPAAFGASRDERVCWLAHEVNDAPHYAYIWGDCAHRFFLQLDRGDRVVSNLHADTVGEVAEMLLSPPNNVPRHTFRAVDLLLFLSVDRRGWQVTRRVSTVYESHAGRHELAYAWSAAKEAFVPHARSQMEPELVAAYRARLAELAESETTGWDAVRQALVTEGPAQS